MVVGDEERHRELGFDWSVGFWEEEGLYEEDTWWLSF